MMYSLKNFLQSSVKRQFIFALILIVALIQIISAGANAFRLRANLISSLKENAEATLEMVGQLVETPLGEFDIPEVVTIIKKVSEQKQVVFVRIFDRSETLLGEFGDFDETNVISVKQKIISKDRGGENLGQVEIAVSKKTIEEAFLRQLYYHLVSSFILIIAITFTVQFLFGRLVMIPILQLSSFAREHGDPDTLLTKKKKDEFGSLARSFARMAQEINNNAKELEFKVAKRTEELEISKIELSAKIKELGDTQELLIKNSNLAAVGRLSASIAHEVSNPLTIIKGNVDFLGSGVFNITEKSELFQKKVNSIQRMVFRISSIVNGMRSISRSDLAQSFKYKSFKLLVMETLELAQMKYRNSDVKLLCNDVPDIDIECRDVQISQVLINLLSNAYDAVYKLPDPWTQLTISLVGESVEFAVTDSGPGIPADIADKLMTPFFTTKAVGEGTGLGLSISLNIAKDHGGTFVLDRKCSNTRFVLTIPISQGGKRPV